MSWFKRLKEGIQTATKNKKETPDGLWTKCKRCKTAHTSREVKDNLYTCPTCNYHHIIGSHEYFEVIFDGKYSLHFENLLAKSIKKH